MIIWLDQEGKGNGHLALIKSIPYKHAGSSQGEAYEKAGFEADARDFRPAAEILNELGVASIILLSNSSQKAEDMRKESIDISGTRDLLVGPAS